MNSTGPKTVSLQMFESRKQCRAGHVSNYVSPCGMDVKVKAGTDFRILKFGLFKATTVPTMHTRDCTLFSRHIAQSETIPHTVDATTLHAQ